MSLANQSAAQFSARSPDIAPDNSYDAVPYSVCAFPQTRPDRLATIATLFGMRPAPPDRCRVLELGCASGGNLIPMALADPQSQFVGFDLSARQIEDGIAVARELQLSNLQLQTKSILDLGAGDGLFDYILVHGVYSWVPPAVQEKILDICSTNLAPQGVAYISYNAYPGWHARAAIREMLWYHTRRLTDPVQRIGAARGMMKFLADATSEKSPARDSSGYGALMQSELALLSHVPDSYLLHEHLEEYNEPLYFHQFAHRASEKGLQYLGEAHIGAMVSSKFGSEIEKTLRQISPDLLHMEQYMDFLRNRMFRQTLLCHDGVKLNYALQPDAVKSFYVASSAKPTRADANISDDQPMEFHGPAKTLLSTRDPLMKSAMLCLEKSWPLPMHYDQVVIEARARLPEQPVSATQESERLLSTRILNCYMSGLLELSLSKPSFAATLSARPMASPYARLRAKSGGKIINYRLEVMQMGDPSRLILGHLDGQHHREALLSILIDWLQKSSPKAQEISASEIQARARQYLDQLLNAFARNALLVA